MQAFYRLLSALLLCACTPEKSSFREVSADTYFPISIGDANPELQLALTEMEQSWGLMHRDELAENHGMLFLFKQPGKRSFWMRNTPIPLDLAYFDTRGVLMEIHSLYPYDENSVYSYSGEVLIAVEMNRGWFSKNNIQPGAKLDLEALTEAVIHRGYPYLTRIINRRQYHESPSQP